MFEMMTKNNFKENVGIVEQQVLDLVMLGGNGTFAECLEHKATIEAISRIDDPEGKYSRAIARPIDSGNFTQELLRKKRANGEEYFHQVCSIGGIDDLDFDGYQSLIQGKSSRVDAEEIRGRFARASVRYEEMLLSSLSSDDMREYLYEKLYGAVLKDFHSLVWQS